MCTLPLGVGVFCSPQEQYWRHLPNASAWSLTLNSSQVRRTGALRVLSGVRRAQLASMQKAIADLLPQFLYLHPHSSWDGKLPRGVEKGGGGADWAQEGKLRSRPVDAFDITINARECTTVHNILYCTILYLISLNREE